MANTLRIFIRWIVLSVFLVTVGIRVQGQTIPYSPERLAMLENKLKTATSKTEKASLLLDIYDQIKSIDPDKANSCTNEALDIAKALNNKLLIARAFCNKGIQQFILNNNEESYRYFVRALALVDPKKDTAISVRCYQNMGVLYRDYGNYGKAIEYKYRAMKLCGPEPKWLDTKCQLRYNLSLDYISVGQITKAEFLLKENLKDLDLFEAPQRKAQTMTVLSQIAQLRHNNEAAINYALKALQITKQYGFFQNTLNNYIFLGQASEALGRKEDCFRYARTAQHLADSVANIFSQATVYLLFSVYYFDNKQLDSATFYALRSIAKLEERKVEAVEPDAYHHYSLILRKLGKEKEALHYENKYRDLLELARNRAVQEFSLNSINAYAISQSYEKINRLYSKPLQQENRWSTVGLTGLVLALLMGVGVFLLYRQRRLSSRQLKQKQTAILAQKSELERLNALKIELFGTIARDLRAPLTSIQEVVAGYKSIQSPEEEKAALDLLREQTDYASARLEEMLQQAKQQMQIETLG